jgi:vacuolar-type H+-ATPase subunit H
MVVSEGSREIEACSRRLASSETAVKSITRILEAAKDAVKVAGVNADEAGLKVLCKVEEVAQKGLDEANADMKDARDCLKDAEKRWHVIDVDNDDEDKLQHCSEESKSDVNSATVIDLGDEDEGSAMNLLNDSISLEDW